MFRVLEVIPVRYIESSVDVCTLAPSPKTENLATLTSPSQGQDFQKPGTSKIETF